MSRMTAVLLDQDCAARIDAQVASGHFLVSKINPAPVISDVGLG